MGKVKNMSESIKKPEIKIETKHKEHKKLGTLASTAISGNDITSSVLYVSALAIVFAGQYAWITLLMVGATLYLFRKIYGEVVGSLPLNGGAYNALLNTTSKSTASFAATLTLLSYMATAVISANEAIHYLHHIFNGIPIIMITIVLLGIFAFLAIIGITESAIVAIGIFLFHLTSLVLLAGGIGYYLLTHGGLEVFHLNSAEPVKHGSIGMAIFWGFSVSMLGISGFESSANFVEEQEKGVFPKTLKNMWIAVGIINPLMAFLALALLPMTEIATNKNTLLSYMGEVAIAPWFAQLISIDAFLVLSGAVLTSYVGVTGLLERMTLDRILPQFLLKKTKRDTSFLIILLFFALSVSVLLITKGNVTLLAGVYTISFLFVMLLFTVGNMLLKVKRAKLPRPEIAPWWSVFLAFAAVSVALYGNIIKEPEPGSPSNLVVFLQYFIPTITFIMVMLNRIFLLKVLSVFIKSIFEPIVGKAESLIEEINSQEFVFFTKNEDVQTLNKVMMYIKKNEQTRALKLVTILPKDEKMSEKWFIEIDVLDREYPEIKIEIVQREGEFGPELIKELSKEWGIPINFMFIGSPSDKFAHRVEDLGGVRLII